MCILLLLERIYWLLFVFYLVGCKIGVGCLYVKGYLNFGGLKSLLLNNFMSLITFIFISYY